MLGMNSIEVLIRLRANGFPHPIIIIICAADIKTAVEAMKAGALDILEEPFDDKTLLHTIGTCIANRGSARLNGEKARAARLIGALSRRESQVLEGLVNGSSNKIIAFELGISARTVEVHRARMMERLGVKQLAEAVRIAVMAQFEQAHDA
jgi:two-component system response regulator FixJ